MLIRLQRLEKTRELCSEHDFIWIYVSSILSTVYFPLGLPLTRGLALLFMPAYISSMLVSPKNEPGSRTITKKSILAKGEVGGWPRTLRLPSQ